MSSQDASGERTGLRQPMADTVEEVTSREAPVSTEGMSGLKPPGPALPPAASRAKSGLLRLAAEGGGEGRGGGIWSHTGLGSNLGITTYSLCDLGQVIQSFQSPSSFYN